MISILVRRHICNDHRHHKPLLTALFNCSTAAKHTPRYQYASKIEHITCQFGLDYNSVRYIHTTAILLNNNNSNDNNEDDIIFTDNYNEDNKVIVLSDEDFLNKTSKHTTTNSIHSSEDDDMSTQTLIPEKLNEDMLEFWDDEDDILPKLEKQTKHSAKKRKRYLAD